MPDIFNRTTDIFGGSFTADSARMTFPGLVVAGATSAAGPGAITAAGAAYGGADTGLLVQNLGINYQQNITRLYEVGTPAIYYVAGRTSGNIQVARVLGPRKIMVAFYNTYGDVCNARTNQLQFTLTAGCNSGTAIWQNDSAQYNCHFAVIVGLGISVSAEQMMISESLQMIFSSLLYQ